MTDTVPYAIGLYIRLSLEDAKVESMSIENQKMALHQFVDTMDGIGNAEILEFVDNGYSGTNFERPAVQRLLDMVRTQRINCIIVKDFTRFGRNSTEVGYFMEKVFPLYNIRFISLNDDFDSARYHGDTGGLNVAFKYMLAEFYSRDLSEKYKTAKYVKFKRGEYQSVRCPYGYQKSADGRMEPDTETAQNVRLIFEMAAGGKSVSDIIQELFNRGIPTPGEYKTAQGKHVFDTSRCCGIWSRSTVLRMLEDERYAGTYIMGKRRVVEVGSTHFRMKDESEWVKIPNHHVPLVSMEVYQRVQQIVPRFKCIKKNKSVFPLRGKVFCGCCRHSMTRAAKKVPDFACHYTEADTSAECFGMRIQETVLESTLYEMLCEQARIVLNQADSADGGAKKSVNPGLDEYAVKIDACQEQKRELYELLITREIDADEYKRRKAAVDKELKLMQQTHAAILKQTEQESVDTELKATHTQLAQEITAAGRLTHELADVMIDRVYVLPGNRLDVVWKMPDFGAGAR